MTLGNDTWVATATSGTNRGGTGLRSSTTLAGERSRGQVRLLEERTVDVHIRRLRAALEATGHDALIQTIRGSGYRISAT